MHYKLTNWLDWLQYIHSVDKKRATLVDDFHWNCDYHEHNQYMMMIMKNETQ